MSEGITRKLPQEEFLKGLGLEQRKYGLPPHMPLAGLLLFVWLEGLPPEEQTLAIDAFLEGLSPEQRRTQMEYVRKLLHTNQSGLS
jgi:hypothetical protein